MQIAIPCSAATGATGVCNKATAFHILLIPSLQRGFEGKCHVLGSALVGKALWKCCGYYGYNKSY